MLLFRWLWTLLILAAGVSFVFYVGTRQPHYRRWSVRLLQCAVVTGLAFFALMLLRAL